MSAPTSHADTPVGRLATWVDQRVGLATFTRTTLDYVFPKHFSFLFGEIALYSFVVLVVTGTFLALFYVPGEAEVVYTGEYAPLVGIEMTEAYRSVVDLSVSVRGGLLMRQTHHWAAIVFTAAIALHMARVFFTGAFRRPRELNWVTGVTLFILATVEGFAGYSLLDDLLSGTGTRIGFSITESIPVVGTWLAYLAWGGEYPGEGFLSRLFVAHIFILPALIAGLIAVHLAMVARPHHTQFRGEGRAEWNVVGLRLWPSYATLSVGFLFLIAAGLVAMGAFLQINPVWLYGPYDVFAVSSGSQADWYVLWIQGALRLMPPWALRLGEWTVPNPFFPAVLFPGVVFGVLYLWPWLEKWATGDRGEHHLLDRPRDHPVRTGIGAATIAALVLLMTVGSDDVLVAAFGWSLITTRNLLRVAVFVVPALVGLAVWKVARDLAARGPEPVQGPAGSPSATTEAGGGEAPASPGSGWGTRVPRPLVTGAAVVAVAVAAAGRVRRRG